MAGPAFYNNPHPSLWISDPRRGPGSQNRSTRDVQNFRCFRRLDLPWQRCRARPPRVRSSRRAKLTVLAGGFEFTEGPAADAQGNVFFTDQPNDRIMKWSTDGKLTTFMKPCGRSNGLCFDAKGNLWACATRRTRCGGSTRRARSRSW